MYLLLCVVVCMMCDVCRLLCVACLPFVANWFVFCMRLLLVDACGMLCDVVSVIGQCYCPLACVVA